MQIINKDITTITSGIIIHGCNVYTMGSGVALAILKKWPKVKKAHQEYVNSVEDKPSLLGNFQLVEINKELSVVNLFSQINFGNDSKKYASVEAIENGIDNLIKYFTAIHLIREYKTELYLPKIGCGLGGLSWELEVEPALKRLEEKHTLEFTICEFQP